MCYAGGPYCYGHMKERYEKSKQRMFKKPTPANYKKMVRSRDLYDSTPQGQEELREKLEIEDLDLDDYNRLKLRQQNAEKRYKKFVEQRDMKEAAKKAAKEASKEAVGKKKPAAKKTSGKKTKAEVFGRVDENNRPIPLNGEHPSTKETAATLRKELRYDFPDTKMSVRMHSGTGHGYIRVSYTDGPSLKEVRNMTSHYEDTIFNGYTDMHESIPGAQWSATGVLVSKEYSQEALDNKKNQIVKNDSGERYIRSADDQRILAYEQFPHEHDDSLAMRAIEKEKELEYEERLRKQGK